MLKAGDKIKMLRVPNRYPMVLGTQTRKPVIRRVLRVRNGLIKLDGMKRLFSIEGDLFNTFLVNPPNYKYLIQKVY